MATQHAHRQPWCSEDGSSGTALCLGPCPGGLWVDWGPLDLLLSQGSWGAGPELLPRHQGWGEAWRG